MVKTGDRTAAKGAAVKHIVDELIARFTTLREASRQTGIPHSTLINWRDGKVPAVISDIERIQQILKIPDSKMWGKVKRGGK